MHIKIDDNDIGLFCRLYEVIGAFADAPKQTIDRLGGGNISIPDDQAIELDNNLSCLKRKHPKIATLRVIEKATQIDDILDRRGFGNEGYDEWFWTNRGFQMHPDWDTIRNLAREILIC